MDGSGDAFNILGELAGIRSLLDEKLDVWPAHRRLERLCRSGLGGVRLPLLVGGAPATLFRLGGSGDHWEGNPGVFVVSINYTTSDTWGSGVQGLGVLRVTANIQWGTGAGQQFAVVDVPARGTKFTVTGADSLQIDVQATGDSNDTQIQVSGTLGLGRSDCSIPAQRCLFHTLPWVINAATNPRIPGFSREVRVVSTVPLAMAGATLSFCASPLAGVGTVAEIDVSDSRARPIPTGAEFFDFRNLIAPFPAQNITTIWELRL